MAKNKYSGGGGFPNQVVADEEKATRVTEPDTEIK